jgi:DNA-directed RNA polymerase specialized sigma24 family protein
MCKGARPTDDHGDYEALRNGDGSAWIRLVRRWQDRLTWEIQRSLRSLDPWEAEDAALEALESLYSRSAEIPSWLRARAYLRAAARQIALKVLRKREPHLRRPRKQRRTYRDKRTHTHTHTLSLSLSLLEERGVEIPDPQAAWTVLETDARDLIREFESRLSDSERVVLSCLVQGHPVREDLPSFLGISEATAKRLIRDCRARCSRWLEGCSRSSGG